MNPSLWKAWNLKLIRKQNIYTLHMQVELVHPRQTLFSLAATATLTSV